MSDYHPTDILTYASVPEMVAAHPTPITHYENDGAILLADCGFEFDAEFHQNLTFPRKWKKIGSLNSIMKTPVRVMNGSFVKTENPLWNTVDDERMMLFMYSEFLKIELSFKNLVGKVFPGYGSVNWGNCTFRYTPTRTEDIHFDVFHEGKPFPISLHIPRVKLFLNVDAEPRIWNVGPRLRDVLRYAGHRLPTPIFTDINVLSMAINKSGILEDCPLQKIEIPQRGVIFANGSTVVHQVVYGNRAVGLEGHLPLESLYSADANEWENVAWWIRNAGLVGTQVSDS